MTLLRVYIAMSLDGYIADSAGGVDWLNPYFCPEIDFMGFAKTIGATVWGRKTFDQARQRGEYHQESGRVVVMTHRPLPQDVPAGIEAFAGDVRELAARLKQELAGTGKDIWIGGGGESIVPFHEARLIDRWEISIIPVLLGEGLPLFPKRGPGVEGLTVKRHRALSNGIIEVHYEPARAGRG
ncbi:MAG: dihydrofolate reductase [Phycisphaerales bacterium]|nr:dihydrofolate reductase [Phycisphaerales bacterium]